MERGLRAWLILVLGIVLIVAGARGRFGSVLGALITPQSMVDGQQAQQVIQNVIQQTLPTWAQGAQLP